MGFLACLLCSAGIRLVNVASQESLCRHLLLLHELDSLSLCFRSVGVGGIFLNRQKKKNTRVVVE